MAIHRLTEEQREFAERNHNLVYKFLNKHMLPDHEFYDIVIFGYLKAVQVYFEEEKLRQFAFSTIAFPRMSCLALRHMRSIQTRPLSLDAPANSEGSRILGECIADPRSGIECVLDRDMQDRALSCCRPNQRKYLILQACGYTSEEIGNRYQCSKRAMDSRINRARRKIRAAQEASI